MRHECQPNPGGSQIVCNCCLEKNSPKHPQKPKAHPWPDLVRGLLSGFNDPVHKALLETVHLSFTITLGGSCSVAKSCPTLQPYGLQQAGLLLFASLLFIAICKASSDSHFAFLHFFSMGMVLIPVSCTMSRTSIHSSQIGRAHV